MVRRRLRIRFRKEGDLRLIGHLDLLRAWERLLRRAEVPLVMSSGCHPRPRITFPSALPMGEEGRDEALEADFDGSGTVESIRAALAACAPAGLVPTAVEETSPDARAVEPCEFAYDFVLPAEHAARAAERLAQLLASDKLLVTRRSGVAVDLRHLLLQAEIEGGCLRFRVQATHEQNLRARDVLDALGLGDLREAGHYPVRTQVILKS